MMMCMHGRPVASVLLCLPTWRSHSLLQALFGFLSAGIELLVATRDLSAKSESNSNRVGSARNWHSSAIR
jgi:hypothetical protein